MKHIASAYGRALFPRRFESRTGGAPPGANGARDISG